MIKGTHVGNEVVHCSGKPFVIDYVGNGYLDVLTDSPPPFGPISSMFGVNGDNPDICACGRE